MTKAYQYALYLLFVFAVTLSAAAQSAPFALTIEGPEGTVKSGEPVTITIRMTNLSDHTLYIPRNSYLVEYQFDILDPSNLPPAETELAYRIRHPKDDGYASAGGSSLRAGGSATWPVILTDYFIMTRSGSYCIRVSRLLPQISPERVTSNPINITVTE